MCVRQTGDGCAPLQVHSGCKDLLSSKCPLGQCKVSVIPPTALNSIDSDGETGRPGDSIQDQGRSEARVCVCVCRLLEGLLSSVLHQSSAGVCQL